MSKPSRKPALRKTTTKRRPKTHPAKKPRAVIRGTRFVADVEDAEVSLFAEITHRKKRAYLEALSTTPSMDDAARLAGVSRKTGYNYRADLEDKPFQAALDVALRMGVQRAEAEGWRRGVIGWEEPVYQGGRLVGTKLVKSDTMLIFMLKGAAPEKYRERFEHMGKDGAPLFAAGFPVPDCGNGETTTKE